MQEADAQLTGASDKTDRSPSGNTNGTAVTADAQTASAAAATHQTPQKQNGSTFRAHKDSKGREQQNGESAQPARYDHCIDYLRTALGPIGGQRV